MRRLARLAGPVLVLALPAAAAAGSVRFPARRLPGGAVAAMHESASGDPSDAAAARRSAAILRSPYARLTDRRTLRGGEVVLAADAFLPRATREALLRDLPPALASLFERDGWARPFSTRAPLLVGVVSGPATGASGWEGREPDGTLRGAVVVVSAASRDASAVLLDALHQIALLSVRQSAPDAPAWAAEGLAEYVALRAAGLPGAAIPEDDPLLAETGSLASPPALAAFLDAAEAELPKGAADVREAWEAAGPGSADDASFVSGLASRSAGKRLADFLAGVVASRLASTARANGTPAAAVARRSWLLGAVGGPAPSALGWRRVSLRTEDERGGLELSLPEAGFGAGRAVVFYRGDAGDFDTIPVGPGEARLLPAAGTAGVHLVLADGDGSEVAFRVRRVPDYPAALAASGAEAEADAVLVSWSTSQHRDLLAWVVERREELPDGEGPPVRETVPAAVESPDPTGYLYADRSARPGARYRYRVLALTRDGFLSEAFEAFVEAR